MRRMLARMSLWTAAILVTACGGSGGGDPAIEGSFFAIGYEADSDPSVVARATWGAQVIANGSTLTMELLQNADGVISGPTIQELDVVVDDEGRVELRDTGSGEAILGGRVGEGGDVVIAASVRDGDLPRLLTLVRDSVGAATADLSGDYHAGLFTFDAGEGRGSTGSATFDGLGSGVFSAGATVNIDGSPTTSLVASPATYTVSPSGVIDMAVAAGSPFQGALDPTGELAVLGGINASTEFPGWMVLVKESVAASNATFSGTYGVVAIAFEPGGPQILSLIGDLVADGAGGVESQGTAVNVDGTQASSVLPTTATYSVSADGTLTYVDGDTLQGGVSPSGRYALLAGGVNAGSFPQMWLLIRR